MVCQDRLAKMTAVQNNHLLINLEAKLAELLQRLGISASVIHMIARVPRARYFIHSVALDASLTKPA